MLIKQIENGIDLSKETDNIAAVYDTSLPEGQNIPLHFHPDFEELYYILSGYGIMTIADEKKEISRNDVIYIPKTLPHSLQNSGNVPLRFITLTVKTKMDKVDVFIK